MSLKTVLRAFALLSAALFVAACGSGDKATDNSNGDAAKAEVKQGVKPEADAEAAVIETDYGTIVVELYPNLAPKMVERFKTLAGRKFYDGTAIHRIDPNLGIIQGGDPNSKDDDPSNDGLGSSDLPNVPAEFSDVPYERGTVGAARGGAEDSANSQFYVTLKRQEGFDGRYTVFGRVIQGINNADIISAAPIAEGTTDRPAAKITVRSVTLVPRSQFK